MDEACNVHGGYFERERAHELEVLSLFIGLLWNRTMLSFVVLKSNADGVLQIKKATTK